MPLTELADACSVVGPDGQVLTLSSLPKTNTTRWVTSRKAQVIAAIKGGLLTLEEASARYQLTLDELSDWQTSLEQHGARGLRATFVQQYRHMRRA
jgi:hypothetical protein